MDNLKDFSEAQTKTIAAQSKKISELERTLETLQSKLIKSELTNTVNNSLSKDQDNTNDDGTTICLVQLAILRAASMNGELTLEECKKTEIYVKTLQIIKGKNTDDKKSTSISRKLTTEELMKLVDEEMKQ